MIMNNTLFRELNAQINNEDSMYTMLLPTDEAYTSSYDQIKNSFKYNTETKYYPITTDGVGSVLTKSEANKDYDGAYLTDSLAKLCIGSSLILAHSNKYNFWLDEVDGPQNGLLDTS